MCKAFARLVICVVAVIEDRNWWAHWPARSAAVGLPKAATIFSLTSTQQNNFERKEELAGASIMSFNLSLDGYVWLYK
jgi:hypothetical protein